MKSTRPNRPSNTIRIKTQVKGGGPPGNGNHNQSRIVVKSGLKAGGVTLNHNVTRLVVT